MSLALDSILDTTTTTELGDPGDHDTFAHYVPKNQRTDAMVFGTPLRALCGKVWVPTRDEQKFPTCPTCKEIFESLPTGEE